MSFFSPGSSEGFTLDVLVSLLHQENAVDLCVIKLPDHIKYADYFIVVSGLSPRHLRAMALYAVKVVTNLNLFFLNCVQCCLFVFKAHAKSGSPPVQISEERKRCTCEDRRKGFRRLDVY